MRRFAKSAFFLVLTLFVGRVAAAQVRSGSYWGDNGSDHFIYVGFQPDFVIVKSSNLSQRGVARTATMPLDRTKELVTANFPLLTNRIKSFSTTLGGGFTVGSDASVNSSTGFYHWIAFKTVPGQSVVGDYVGNGGAGQTIDVGFQPAYVIVMSENTRDVVHRSAAMPDPVSYDFDNGEYTNGIVALSSNGFQVGSDNRVNEGGKKHYYVAWGAVPGKMNVGVYTGTGIEHSISGIGLRPEYVIVKRSGDNFTGTSSACAKSVSTGPAADDSMRFTAVPNGTDEIKALEADGFRVGIGDRANRGSAPNNTYYWAAFANLTDFSIAKDDGMTSAVPGTSHSYTITVTNNGPDNVTSLVVDDPVPSGLTGASFAPSRGTYDPGSGIWRFDPPEPELAATESVTLTLSGTIEPSARGTLVNTATVTPYQGTTELDTSLNAATDGDTVLTPQADLVLAKSDGIAQVEVGGTFGYTLTVSNPDGPSDANDVVVKDMLPREVEIVLPPPPGCSYDEPTRSVACTFASVPKGGPARVVTISVRAISAGPVANTARILSSDVMDPVPDNDTATDDDTVIVPPSTAVRFFSATATDGRVVLQWVNPTISGPPDYDRTELYARTDHFTTDPLEPGNQLVCAQSREGLKDSCPHVPGAAGNGTTYYYTAFVRMTDSSLSGPRFVKGRPFVTGQVKFAYSTGATSMAPPGVGVEAIHAVSNDNALHSVWKATRASEVGEWPTFWQPLLMMGPSQGRPSTIPVPIGTHARIVYLGSQDGKVYAIDADNGEQVWSTSLRDLWAPATQLGVQAQPSGMFLAFGGTHDYILVGTRYSGGDNAFYALDRSGGGVVPGWPFSDGGADGKIGIIASQATVDYATKRVYFTSFARGASDNRTVWCLDLDTGAKVWAKPHADVTTSPTLRGDKLYVGTAEGQVLALDAVNVATYGDAVWSFPTGDGPVKGFIMADRLGRDLYFATSSRVWALSDTGPGRTEKWGGTPPGSRTSGRGGSTWEGRTASSTC
jgi:uncharacterized repeat protein (TIGR01451 family)